MSRILCTSPFPRLPVDLPSDALVVTPHSPAAEYAHRPKVTLQSLARKILAGRGLVAADPRIAARLLREAVHEVNPQADSAAIARRIASVLKTVLRTGIDTTELQQYGSGRACELALIAEAYRRRLRAMGLVHTDELIWEAANSPSVTPEILYIYGYSRARKEEIAFINRIAGNGSVFYLPIIEAADAFTTNAIYASQMSGWGWTLDHPATEQRTIGEEAGARLFDLRGNSSSTEAYKFHDIGSEVRYVLGRVKQLLRGGTPAGDIAIVVRDLDLYAKEFAVVGREYGVPTRSSLRVPLSETLVGGFVGLLLSVVEKDFPFEETARLLGHPLGPGMSDETWRNSRRERTENFYAWSGLEESLKCLDSIRDDKTKPASHWVKCLRSVFAQFDIRSRAGHIPREIVAYNCMQDELSFIAAEPAEITFAEFTTAVRDILAETKTDFDPSRLGVLISEPHIVTGGKFQHLFVLGLAEGVLPALPSDNPVIDFHERGFLVEKGIDFEEAADVPRWEELSFFSLLATATSSVTLTYPKTIGKEEKIASSFFRRLGLEPSPAVPTVLSSTAEVFRNALRKNIGIDDPIYTSAARQYSIELIRESNAPHDEYDGVIGEAIDVTGREWSVSQLSTLAGCGFKWFARYCLRLHTPDEMEMEVSAAARGSLFHYALDFAVSQGGAKTRDEVIHLLDHALASGYHNRHVGMPRVTNWDLRRADYVATLTRAVRAADFLTDRAEIIGTEQDFSVDINGFQLRGRIDRVDRTPSGIVAVDYKSSSKKPGPVRDREGRKLDLQIAVYLAALKIRYPDEIVDSGRYYSLSGCKSHPADVADNDTLNGFLTSAIEAPQTGYLPVRPISSDTCNYCDYDQLCRKGSRLLRKETLND